MAAGHPERDGVARPTRKNQSARQIGAWQRNLRPLAQSGGRRFRRSTYWPSALGRNVQPCSTEGVRLVPWAPDVEELQTLEGMRDRRVDDQMTGVGLETEQIAHDEPRR